LNYINPAKCTELDYINFLIASSRAFSCTEASKCSFIDSTSPAHDSFIRLLIRQSQVKSLVTPETGVLIIDDTVLNKPYSKRMDLVYRQWSGKNHQIVNGINLETVVWTYNDAIIPVDFRTYALEVQNQFSNLILYKPQKLMLILFYNSIQKI
jgi:hypothetical protein